MFHATDLTRRSGRGNVFLEAAVPLTKSLHRQIVKLGRRLEDAASELETPLKGTSAEDRRIQLMSIVKDIKDLLERIDRDIPLLQLAITASGESMSTGLPLGVSPSRLLQASTFLMVGDTQFATDSSRPVQIGPSFTLSLYMLFVGHSESLSKTTANSLAQVAPPQAAAPLGSDAGQHDDRPYGMGEGERMPIWQEVLHKARVRICRTPMAYVFGAQKGYHSATGKETAAENEWPVAQCSQTDHFSYFLEIIEDLDDGRVHDAASQMSSFEDVEKAGIREAIPIHQIAKIFYTDTGRILNIGSESDPERNPVLLLKRDVTASIPKHRLDPSAIARSLEEKPVSGNGEDGDGLHDEIDGQIRSESEIPKSPIAEASLPCAHAWSFPAHVDPEWLALEVFTEDDDESTEVSESTVDESDGDVSEFGPESPATPTRLRPAVSRRLCSSLDFRLIEQIRNISLRSPNRKASSRPSSSRSATVEGGGDVSLALQSRSQESQGAFVARSPFGAITSSLSLLEMLVRLTSLQEFRQTSHLAIPDHVLTFFLEETSTTGLRGDERLRARTEAKRKVGFDPYTDAPGRWQMIECLVSWRALIDWCSFSRRCLLGLYFCWIPIWGHVAFVRLEKRCGKGLTFGQ